MRFKVSTVRYKNSIVRRSHIFKFKVIRFTEESHSRNARYGHILTYKVAILKNYVKIMR